MDIKTNIANAQEGNTFLENIDANSEVIKIKDTVTKIKEEDKSANELNKTSIDGIKNEFLIEIGSDYERNMKTNNKNVYEEKKIYKCGECDVRFTTKNHLEEHITVHDQKEFFKCINCDRTFSQKSNLEEHFESFHNIKKTIKCEFCSDYFSESKQMDDHIASNHDKKTLFQCIYCEKNFAERLKLKDHVLSTHEVKKSPLEQLTPKTVHEEEKIEDPNIDKENSIFCCRVCGRYFQDIPTFLNHLENHSQCGTKGHLNFLKSQRILPSSFEKITNDLDHSVNNSKKLLDLSTEIINDSVRPENDFPDDVILGI